MRLGGLAWLPLCISTALSGEVPDTRREVLPSSAVWIVPGMWVQDIVDVHPPGTTYLFGPGVHRLQQITPKDGDRFIGTAGARLSGARVLAGARREGRFHVLDQPGPIRAAARHGVCQPDFPLCDRPRALFLDDEPLRPVARLDDVAPGRWYLDEETGRVFLAEDPAGRLVELTVTPFAFGGAARGVTIQGLTVERYASPNQRGAINDAGAGHGWTIRDNLVRHNYGQGINLGPRNRAIGNRVHGNGQLGIGGSGDGILVEGNEIARNAWNGVDCEWECGGAKWGEARGLTVRDNHVFDNGGTGLWTDENCRDVLFEANRVERNARAGISHEVSFRAVIRDNVLRGNGAGTHRWGWRAQIQVQNASDVMVVGNVVETDRAAGGNGIALIQQDRGPAYRLRDVAVLRNDVTMAGGPGFAAGWFADFDPEGVKAGGNRFEANRYRVPDAAAALWFANSPVGFASWQAVGADRAGTAEAVTSAPAGSAPARRAGKPHDR